MSTLIIQASFNSGEWSPALFARVDIQKYRSGAALLENFFVDYRGGASSRSGTKYIIQARTSASAVRLIPFQATSTVGFALEFGDRYIRFIFRGSPVLENSFNLSGATQANPCVLSIPGNNFVTNDIIFVQNVVGMTQLNGRYFKVTGVAGASVTIADQNGNAINSTGYGAYVSGGTAARVYTVTSPYAAADLAQLKYAQSVNQMVLVHPSYQPYVLTEITATNWTILPITIGTTAAAPTINFSSTNLTSGSVKYAYMVTSIDANGNESSPSIQYDIVNYQDIRTIAGSIQIGWNAVAGAVSYNVYKAEESYVSTVPAGSTFGFIGSTTGNRFTDTNIAPDFTITPPIAKNPFQGSGVTSVTVTAPGTYTTVPAVSFTGAASTISASAVAVLQVQGTPTIGAGGTGYVVGDTVLFSNNVVLVVNSIGGGGSVATWRAITDPLANGGSITSGSTPANPVPQLTTSGAGTGATANLTWGVGQVQVQNPGAGYLATPTVTFSAGAATATANLSATSNGYPSVAGFFQQRLVLGAPTGAPQTFYMSQPGNYFNFNVSSPTKSDDAITATLVSGVLNTIKSFVSSSAGLLVLTDRASWMVNGGSAGSAVTPSAIVANAQSFNGASDVPPIVANYDVLYVQNKGASVRDLAFNIYFNTFTGTDISILPSHLFFGHQVLEWAWAEEPFKVVWAVRDDGVMLTLTFLKEQDFVGWSHQVTNGLFKSVCAITEASTPAGTVDAIYAVVQRTINGNTVKYIERVAERIFPNGAADAWTVDAGLQYVGAPATNFTGGEHLANAVVTGLADGVVIPPFTMPASGAFTLATPASKVTVGLAFTAKLQTLGIDTGDPTIQGKVKKIAHVTARVRETLGLKIGPDFNNLTPMKDLVVGAVGTMLTGLAFGSQQVTGLFTGDARTYLSGGYTVPGQYCFQQDQPLPASILGVIPDVIVGDEP